MDTNQEAERILMNIKQSGGGMMSLVLFSARAEMQLFQFLARMVKKALITRDAFGEYKAFLEQTEGNYTVFNVPISKDGENGVQKLKELGAKLSSAQNGAERKQIAKEIAETKSAIAELEQLKKLGILHYVLPKIDSAGNTLQVAVDKKDAEVFKSWFQTHIRENLTGGETDITQLKDFTEDNYTIYTMPFKGQDVDDMATDFRTLGINCAVMPRLNVWSESTPVAVANRDIQSMQSWFALWRKRQEMEGKTLAGEPEKISGDAYLQTSELDREDYIAGSDRKYREAAAEFGPEGEEIFQPDGIRRENTEEFIKLEKNPEYEKIRIDKKTLVDDFRKPGFDVPGWFQSRLPGTYGKRQETLALPTNCVFAAESGAEYIGFVPKSSPSLVVRADGHVDRRDSRDIAALYAKTAEGMRKARDISATTATKEAAAEFEPEGEKIFQPDGIRRENTEEFIKLEKNPEYEKIRIDKKTLVDDFRKPGVDVPGWFQSRLPGTYGKSQETLALPTNCVFAAESGAEYIGFVPKSTPTLVVRADGHVDRRDSSDIAALYAKTAEDMRKASSGTKEAAGQQLAEAVKAPAPKPSGPKAPKL